MNLEKNWQSKLLWFLGVAPLLLAWVMASTGWGLTQDTKNHGEFVPPGLKVPKELSQIHRGRWGLLFMSDLCDLKCKDQLILMQQVHKSLGKEFNRLQSIWLKPNSYELFPPRNHPKTEQNAKTMSLWLQIKRLPIFDGSIWLIDPEGNMALRFPIGTDGKDILKDIRWLLKVSKIG